jgi:hypothetical protein
MSWNISPLNYTVLEMKEGKRIAKSMGLQCKVRGKENQLFILVH